MIFLAGHFILSLILIITGFLWFKDWKKILFLILPGIIIPGGTLIIFILLLKIDKQEGFEKSDRYEPFTKKEMDISSNIYKNMDVDDKAIFYTYSEKIIPENHSLYYIKNIGKKKNVESQVLAASAIMNNEQKILKKIFKYEKELTKERNIKNISILANALYNYCYYGYGTKKVQQESIKRAIDLVKSYMKDNNDKNRELLFLLGKLYIFTEEYDKAESCFLELSEWGRPYPVVLSYIAEIYFYKKEYKKMKEILQFLSFEEGLNERLREVIKFWQQ